MVGKEAMDKGGGVGEFMGKEVDISLVTGLLVSAGNAEVVGCPPQLPV